jgi:hypothetical protein
MTSRINECLMRSMPFRMATPAENCLASLLRDEMAAAGFGDVSTIHTLRARQN